MEEINLGETEQINKGIENKEKNTFDKLKKLQAIIKKESLLNNICKK